MTTCPNCGASHVCSTVPAQPVYELRAPSWIERLRGHAGKRRVGEMVVCIACRCTFAAGDVPVTVVRSRKQAPEPETRDDQDARDLVAAARERETRRLLDTDVLSRPPRVGAR